MEDKERRLLAGHLSRAKDWKEEAREIYEKREKAKRKRNA